MAKARRKASYPLGGNLLLPIAITLRMEYHRHMSPKDALRKWNADNPTKAIAFSEGRGRLSREAVSKCSELVGNGWSITGYAVSTAVSPKSSASTAPVAQEVTRVKTTNEKVIQEFVILYDERMYSALDKSGKVWSMRNACNNCRVSLVQCHCGKPTIFGDIPVTIKANA